MTATGFENVSMTRCLEDETVHRPEFANQMPLIHPRDEQGEFEKFYVEDLGIVGEGRYGLADTQDSENLQLTREERTFLGVADNGDVGMQWEEVDTMSIPEEDLHILQSVIENWPTKQ